MAVELHQGHVTWRLPAEFNIYHAAPLKLELEAALEADLPLICELSAVEEMDASALQLLMLAARECHARRIELRFQQPSPACLEACGVMGFQQIEEATA